MNTTYEARTATARLRPGPGGLPRGQVRQIQRSRMLAAAVEAVEDVGYSRMTVAQVIGRARVSRKTFYDVFVDREDCFLAAFEQGLGQARHVAQDAYGRQDSWRSGIRAALKGLLLLMDEEPALAKLCVVEALGAGDRVLDRRAKVLGELAQAIDLGRTVTSTTREPPAVTAEGIVGAVFAVLHTRALVENGGPLSDLSPALMSMIVLPYLGARAAGAELKRSRHDISGGARLPDTARSRDPLEGLKMRLTYRTVRVLIDIARHPGASNREIAERSGISDQGQISKLLNRLARLELVENVGGGQERGAANAWRLTARGLQVERATRPR